MTEYTIAAIPTVYRGRQYRSRLEARWAAFFDRLGWTHEYEPFDLGAWSPDFAITQPFDALVEVKPITELDRVTAEKIRSARVASGSPGFTLLTNVAPLVLDDETVMCGWSPVTHQPTLIVWSALPDRPAMKADLLTFIDGKDYFVTSSLDGGALSECVGYFGYPDYTMRLWADACNAVQWEPGQ